MENLSQVVAAPAFLAMGFANAIQAGQLAVARERVRDNGDAARISGAASSAWAEVAGDAQAALIGAQARICQLERALERSERARRQLVERMDAFLDATA